MADGATRPGRGVRPLNPARMAAVREGLDPTADFAEEARRVLDDLATRLGVMIHDGDLTPCRQGLERMQAHLAALSPAALTPRGWFDSRSRRLKRFRHAFDAARREAAQVHADLDHSHARSAQRNGALVALWNETRDAVAHLDAHVAAGRDWLAEQAADDARLAGFRRRIEDLDAFLVAAVRRLPLALGAQNADLTARDHVRAAADALSAWRADWTRALGMEGRKWRKIAPAPSVLAEARDALTAVIAAADQALASAGARRAEILGRLTRLN